MTQLIRKYVDENMPANSGIPTKQLKWLRNRAVLRANKVCYDNGFHGAYAIAEEDLKDIIKKVYSEYAEEQEVKHIKKVKRVAEEIRNSGRFDLKIGPFEKYIREHPDVKVKFVI